MIKMMFVTPDADRAQTWTLLSNKLRERGIESSFVTYSKEVHLFFEKRSMDCVYLPDEIGKIKVRGDLKKHLAKIEAKYDIPSLELFLIGDLEHSRMERWKAYTIMLKHFYFWENYLRKNKVDFIAGGIERFVHMIPREVSKKFKTQYISLLADPLPGRFSISKDASGHFSSLDEYWVKNRDRALTEKEREDAERFIESFRRKLERLYAFVSEPKINMQKIKFLLDRTRVSLLVEKGKLPYMDVSGGTYRYLLKMARANSAKKYYSKFDPNEKYVFYPLHVITDAQILVRAPQYINQLYVVENISRSLPAGYWLYVKEHPGDIGGTQLRVLKKISRLPNVKLLSPFESSVRIIRGSACVVTINSTVGWESLLLRKPVINLGRAFYETSCLTYSLRNFYKLPETIRLAIRLNPVKDDILIKFVNAVFAATYPGDILRSSLYWGDSTRSEIVNQDENIENVADGICNQLKQWGYKF